MQPTNCSILLIGKSTVNALGRSGKLFEVSNSSLFIKMAKPQDKTVILKIWGIS